MVFIIRNGLRILLLLEAKFPGDSIFDNLSKLSHEYLKKLMKLENNTL